MSLKPYHGKRKFTQTPEPRGAEPAKQKKPAKDLKFVVQWHEASHRHWDLRLELDGVMLSWAVPKGPSLDPLERRLSVHVEDHPMEYNDFEGVIPRGNYGAGSVMIWDEGTYEPRSIESPAVDARDALRRALAKGDLKIVFHGTKLRGEFALVRLAKGGGKNWLLLKKRDQFATNAEITHSDRSVRSGRTMGEIAANAPAEGRIWLPGKGESEKAKAKPSAAAPKQKPKPKGKVAASQSQSLPPSLRRGAETSEQLKGIRLTTWRKALRIPAEFKGTELLGVLDGYRAAASGDGEGGWILTNAGGGDISAKFLGVVKSLKPVLADVVLDGMVVAVDDDGLLRRRGHLAPNAKAHYRFYAYDLLYADGLDFRNVPLKQRMAALSALELPESQVGVPPTVAAKSLDESSEAPPGVVGVLGRDTGSNYDAAPSLVRWRTDAAKRKGKAAAVALPRATPLTQRPLTSDVTVDSQHEVLALRQPVTKHRNLTLTRPEKVYWPADGKTKGDLLEYYRYVAPLMLPHLKDRPLSLNRHPDGIDGKSFFQKEVVGHVPTWMPTATISSGRSGKTVTYALCSDVAELLFLANMGCIEINAWLSRVTSINNPDFIVIDLDPGAIAFSSVIEVALAVRRLLEAMGIESFPKTSGSRGLHVYIPVSDATYLASRGFAELLMREVNRLLPQTTSLDRSPAKRPKLIYLDYLQNRIAQTMAAAYCVRPRPGATVSTPLKWSEVRQGLDPTQFTIETMKPRLDRLGDLWTDVLRPARTMASLQDALKTVLKGS